MSRFAVIAAFACLAASGAAVAEIAWPEPSLPRATQIEAVGDDMHINGMPTRAFTFASDASVEQVVEHFRAQIDRDLTTVPARQLPVGTTALGGRHGDFWLTLKVQQAGKRATGLWSATPRFIANAKQRANAPIGFPDSAKLIQQIDSYDIGKHSQMAIGLDPSPIDGVAQRMEQQMRAEGFVKQALPARNWTAPDRYVAVFGRARDEIWVTLQQRSSGTAVTVNHLSALEVLE